MTRVSSNRHTQNDTHLVECSECETDRFEYIALTARRVLTPHRACLFAVLVRCAPMYVLGIFDELLLECGDGLVPVPAHVIIHHSEEVLILATIRIALQVLARYAQLFAHLFTCIKGAREEYERDRVCGFHGLPLVIEHGQEVIGCFLKVELAVFGKVPHLSAHLYEHYNARRARSEDELATLCNVSRVLWLTTRLQIFYNGLQIMSTQHKAQRRATHYPHARECNRLVEVDATVDEVLLQSPHVAATDELIFER